MQVEYIDHMGNDESIVRAARVSFSGDQRERDAVADAGLIRYLAEHNHWTPFAHTAITLRVTAPVPIRTQCFKHKQGFVENEESRRYIRSEPTFFFPTWRGAVTNKKQGSGEALPYVSQVEINKDYIEYIELAKAKYLKYITYGVCEEQARFVLPQGTEVNWYWTGSLAAFSRFCHQRMDSHAQLEIQELAREISDIIAPLYPIAWEQLVGDK
tara:strand:- start:3559 stop:4197 length:639 start_codon:yes stop_codon:yes gene_type:complete